MSLGTKSIAQTTGRNVTVAAGNEIKWLPFGVAIAWDKVDAAVSDTVLGDDTKISTGDQYLRYGDIMVPVLVATEMSITVTGTPSGGKTTATFEILGSEYPIDIAYNATASEVADAINDAVGGDYDVVAVTGTPGSYTLKFDVRARKVEAPDFDDDYSGGSAPEAAASVSQAGDDSNRKWAKWNGSDGLVRDQVGILNWTIVKGSANLHSGYIDTDTTGLIRGGIVYKERLNVTSDKLAAIQTAMPELRFMPGE